MGTYNDIHVGAYLILKTKETDLKVGGNICSDGCKTNGRVGDFCSNCGVKITFDQNVTFRMKPSYNNLTDRKHDDELWCPSWIDGEANFQNGVSVCIPNGEYTDTGGPLKIQGTWPMGNHEFNQKIVKDFCETYKDIIAFLQNHEDVIEVMICYGVVEYGN